MNNVALVVVFTIVALLESWQFGIFGGSQQAVGTTTLPAATNEPAAPAPEPTP